METRNREDREGRAILREKAHKADPFEWLVNIEILARFELSGCCVLWRLVDQSVADLIMIFFYFQVQRTFDFDVDIAGIIIIIIYQIPLPYVRTDFSQNKTNFKNFPTNINNCLPNCSYPFPR